MKATIYCRISEDRTGQQLGVERQEQECRAFCEQRGWTVREVLTDNDISATTGKLRPGFERLLTSKPEVIVTWHTDRLVRLTSDLERVIELGVNVHALHAGHLDLSSPAGRAVARTITAWSAYEGEQKSIRQKASAKQRATAGRPWWPHRPFGLELDGTLRAGEAEALQGVYRDVLNGASVYGAAQRLNEAGHLTAYGKPWTQPSLRVVLLNPRNAAIRTYRGEEVGPAGWSPIVPEETFRALVALFNTEGRSKVENRGPKVERLLTGIAKCGKCGGRIRVHIRSARGTMTREHIYMCRDGSCVSHFIDWADSIVIRRTVDALSEEHIRRYWTEPVNGGDSAQEVQSQKRGLEQRLNDAADRYADGEISLVDWTRAADRMNLKVVELDAQLARAGRSELVGEVLGDIEHMWEVITGMDVETARRLVSDVMEEVLLLPRGRGTRQLRQEHIVTKPRGL